MQWYFLQAGVVSWRAGQTSCLHNGRRLQDGLDFPKQVAGVGGVRVHSGGLKRGPDSSKQVGDMGEGQGVRVLSGVAANSCWIRATLKCNASRLFAVHDHVSSNLVDFLAVFNI